MQIYFLLPLDSDADDDDEEILIGDYVRGLSLGEEVACGKCGVVTPVAEYYYTKTEYSKGSVNIDVLCSDCHIDHEMNKDEGVSWNGNPRKDTRQKSRNAAMKRMRKKGLMSQRRMALGR